MNREIMDFIVELQRGKSGIYPYRVALEVCAKFQISIEEAQEYVTKHIQQVLAEAKS
jgi:hypothetical protein